MPSPFTPALLDYLKGGARPGTELLQRLNVSQATFSRATAEPVRQGQVLRLGRTRGARYALRRTIGNIGSSWPVYRVDAEGAPQEFGTLYALAADQYWLESPAGTNKGSPLLNRLSNGLPYLLQDQRPAGFLGRNVPLIYPELELPQRVSDWTDDHYLIYLTQRGVDTVGNLIVGAPALDRYLAATPLNVIATNEREVRYPQLADAALTGSLPGSSAHGEHPKFTASIGAGKEQRQVLVKFSPPRDTAAGLRWSDLLIAEHQAHVMLNSVGIIACQSQLMLAGNRAFLEVTRFDRVGARGRIGVTSLFAIDAANYGQLDNWIAAAERLATDRSVSAEDLHRIRFLSAFGALIANTDRHFGNLAFFDNYAGKFQLAPVYDMLPMLFAPEHDQMVKRVFTPPQASAQTLAVWPAASALARRYWQMISEDPSVSPGFREIAAECLSKLQAPA